MLLCLSGCGGNGDEADTRRLPVAGLSACREITKVMSQFSLPNLRPVWAHLDV